MRKVLQKSGLRLWFGTISVSLLFLVIGPQTAEAQTNTFPTTGNAGIGTTTPGSPLEVKATQPDISINHTDTSLFGRLLFKEAGAQRGAFQFLGSAYATVNRRNAMEFYNNYGPIMFYTNSTGTGVERMRIDTSGNVGIGTASPTAKLHLISADDTVAPALSIRQDSNPAYGFDFALDTNVNGNLSVKRVNNGTSAPMMVLDRAGGNVGIGTSSPTSPLFVAGNEPSNDYATLRVKPTVTHGGIVKE